MATIAENLQTLFEQKAAIKAALQKKGKPCTEELCTYAGLIEELENEEQISYVLTNADGTQRALAVKAAEEPITLTATENDIRKATTAITDKGYTEGQKDIPSYNTKIGVRVIQANTDVVLPESKKYDYTEIQATLAVFNASLSASVQVDRVTVDDALYMANSTTKLADLIKDHENEQVDFGVTNGDKIAVMRYTIIREEY